MNKPIEPRPGESGDPVVDALRASLTEHARHAPAADVLAERIIASVDTRPPARDLPRDRRRGWSTWTLPLVAAGSVAAVVGAAIGIAHYNTQADKAPPAASISVSPSVTHQVSTPAPSPSPTSSPSPTTIDTSTLHHVEIIDLTFAGVDDGWALASADCIRGAGRCTALLRTTDGKTWKSIPGAAFHVTGVNDCTDPCVKHVRFANDQVGYAYGQSAFFMTSDGGQNWQRQGGGAEYVETLAGNVIRVVSSSHGGCPGPCDVQVETAALGSTTWKTETLASTSIRAAGLSFTRGGSDAYLLVTRNPAGGAANQTSTLYRSIDRGLTWTAAGEPCPQTSGEVDSYAVAAGGGSRVSALCGTRQAPQRWFVATSSDDGATFSERPGTIPTATATATLLAGDPTTVLITGGIGLSRSTDGGRSWVAVPGVAGAVSFVGFESDTVGRVVGDNGRAIWTTRDAGASWTKVSFG
jgi:hypothetical protein